MTINVDGTDNNRLSTKEISGTSWNGVLTLDGTTAPLNVPGTYTIKLFVGVDADDPNWAEVDQATLTVVEPQKEVIINGAFGQKNYTMTTGETLDVAVSASAQNANLTRVTINMDGGGYDKEISGTSWNGSLMLNSAFAPLNVPGTYTIKLIVGVDAGNPNWAEVDQATLTVTSPEEDNQKLPDPVITSPSAGDVFENTTFTLSWNAVNGADHYVYTASDLSQDAVKVIPVTATNGLSVELTLPEKGHNYRAAVGAVPAGVNDNESDKISWNTVEFSVQSEPKQLADPTITYPSNGAVLDSTSVTVSWNDVDGAVDFAISVYDITSDKYIADRELTDYAFNAVINDLEWFHQYRVAVGAVPRKAKGDSTKYSWSTVEFSVARAFIGTPTLEATGKYSANGDPTYRVTAVTDGHITRLSAVNDIGTPLNETWNKTNNADGTITWVRVYTPSISAANRTWTLTAWYSGKAIDTASTNTASMHVHSYGAKKYKDAHPHQYYQVCTACGHELLLYNQYYTANGTVQNPAVCCICHGHQYGDAYEENGAWYRKCNNCGKIIAVEAQNRENEMENEHTHVFIDGVCSKCGYVCPHDFSKGSYCSICNMFNTSNPCANGHSRYSKITDLRDSHADGHSIIVYCPDCRQTFTKSFSPKWDCIECNGTKDVAAIQLNNNLKVQVTVGEKKELDTFIASFFKNISDIPYKENTKDAIEELYSLANKLLIEDDQLIVLINRADVYVKKGMISEEEYEEYDKYLLNAWEVTTNNKQLTKNEIRMITDACDYLKSSQDAYDSDYQKTNGNGAKLQQEVVTEIKYDQETKEWKIADDSIEGNAIRTEYPDCLIETSMSSNGKKTIRFSFEGSQGDKFGVISAVKVIKTKTEESMHEFDEGIRDWFLTDYNAIINENGIHSGFDDATNQFINLLEYIPFSDKTSDYSTLQECLLYAQSHPEEIEIQITGHSLGGALAQVFTYYLIKDYHMSKDQITTYTFASPVPFSTNTVKSNAFNDLNVYNFINIRDVVPKFGIANGLMYDPVSTTIKNEVYNWVEMLAFESGITGAMPGGFVINGTNLGTNIYMSGDGVENIGKEHDLETYLSLMTGHNTVWNFVDTRQIFQ